MIITLFLKHSVESKLRISKANSAHTVYVYNSYKKLQVIYPSVNALAYLIKSNPYTILSFINSGMLFRGEWYFAKSPFNRLDVPLITCWTSVEAQTLKDKIKNNTHIVKAIFVYNTNKEFLRKFDGVMQAKKELKLSHDMIKRHAKLKTPYKGYIFSYERLLD